MFRPKTNGSVVEGRLLIGWVLTYGECGKKDLKTNKHSRVCTPVLTSFKRRLTARHVFRQILLALRICLLPHLNASAYIYIHIRFYDALPFTPITMHPSSQVDTTKQSTSFVIPDLVSHCTFPLSYHANGDEVAQQSVNWLDTNCPDLDTKQRRALHGLQAGELTAYCYHTASPERLRVVSDFMNYLFHLWDFT